MRAVVCWTGVSFRSQSKNTSLDPWYWTLIVGRVDEGRQIPYPKHGSPRPKHQSPGHCRGVYGRPCGQQAGKREIGILWKFLFIPIFFIVTGFLIDPVVFFRSITTNFPLVSAVICALLVGKWIAAQTVGRALAYTPAARMTMWSLTLPQVAATLAAALVAFETRNPAGQRLVDSRLLNVILVLMVTTSILGPVLTEHFAPRLLKEAMPPGPSEDRRNTLIP
jgi:hypothetical protein